MIDENEFFRHASLHICGNLQLEEAMVSFLRFIQDYMPADRLFLSHYDKTLGVMRTLVDATPEKGTRMDAFIPVSEKGKEYLNRTFGRGTPAPYCDNNPHESPVSKRQLAARDQKAKSVLILPFGTPSAVVGTGAFVSEELTYTDEHVKLMSLLIAPFQVAMTNALQHAEIVKLRDRLADDNRELQRELLHIAGDDIIGADFGLRDMMQQVRQVAPTESPVLLTGETGVGKDVIASAIHLGSSRRDGPFIPVNCGAIPDSLLDSELFGHEKGAFTGALSKKRGRFERADKGTILLDEIGEMPLEAQVRLLRVLQHREIERVGGTDRITVDIRIIAATNKDLPAMIEDGRFREDLFFRLSVFPIVVPPLRERTSDIPALVQFFVERKAGELKVGDTPRLAPGAIDTLMSYSWPGNVRELENVVERAMILHQGEPLRFDDLSTSLSALANVDSSGTDEQLLHLDTVTAAHIKRGLAKTGGKIHGPGGAGELLGVNANTLRYKMKKLGVSFGRNKRAE